MLKVGDSVTVTKYKLGKTAPFTYPGKVINLLPGGVVVEAYFNVDEHYLLDGLVFKRGDRFVETYFTDRWYNIFEVHDRESDRVKCWYCNVAEPAVFEGKSIWFIDLALDLVVYPNHKKLVLDEDEFKALMLPDETCDKALSALEELKKMIFV